MEVTFIVSEELVRLLEELAAKEGLTKEEVGQRALKEYLKSTNCDN